MNHSQMNSILCQLETPEKLNILALINRSRKDENRFIYIVNTQSNQFLVVKCYKNNYTTIEKINGWAKLARTFIKHNVTVPEF